MQSKYINGKNFLVEQEMVPTPLKRENYNQKFQPEYAYTFRFCNILQQLSVKISMNYYPKFTHSQETVFMHLECPRYSIYSHIFSFEKNYFTYLTSMAYRKGKVVLLCNGLKFF